MGKYNVIFDMDGVIFDSERSLMDCWIETSVRYGVDKERMERTYIKCIGTNDNQTREIYESEFLGELGSQQLNSLWDDSVGLYKSRYSDGLLPVKKGVREILSFLKERNIIVGIASSSKHETILRQLDIAGISDYFSAVVGGDSVKISKPNPEIYLLACNALDVAPSETFAIEDSFNGIRAAHAAGMRPVMVPDIVEPDDEMKSLSEAICGSLVDAMNYLSRQ
ncbi:MAG: HAD family phosphatase [Oribacterium sp.]|nr:HAD family phosphatase [Oribacterium sp.]